MRRLLLRFLQMDRRWIFLGMGFAILIPMLYPVDLPFRVDERVRAVYDAIEELEPGSRVLISADFDPAGMPEIGPFFRANLHHLMRQDIKIVVLCLWEFAPPIVVSYLDEVSPSYDYEYGTDYAFLGYKPGQELAIKAIGENITKAFPSDYRGAPLSELPIMQGLKQARDFDLLVLVSAGSPGTREYVLQIQGQHDLRMVSSTTAVSGPDYIPFYKAGQLVGLAAGMPGSAQYEKLVWPEEAPEGVRKLATLAVNVLNLGHVFIIVLLIVGNVAYFLTRHHQEA